MATTIAAAAAASPSSPASLRLPAVDLSPDHLPRASPSFRARDHNRLSLRRAVHLTSNPRTSRNTTTPSALRQANGAITNGIEDASGASTSASSLLRSVDMAEGSQEGSWKMTGDADVAASVSASAHSTSEDMAGKDGARRPPRVLVAGGGIGGLVFALAAKIKGMDVKVLERDLSAIRGEGQYRGPIQIQSNALAALEAVDERVAEEIMAVGCITGDRINGLVDGISGNWYIKFDTFTPAAEKGLPVTRVISRMTLQQILAEAVGPDIIENSSNVVDFEDSGSEVTVVLEDGQRLHGDLLVGADGIWSKVRTKLFGPCEATYSGYTCYTGIADFIPPDIDTVGYRVYLGHKQYFVSSDVGYGKMQWYAFYNEPAGGVDTGDKKDRLLKLFANWCDGVIDLLLATPEEMILRRDIYDRVPIFSWSKGRVTLLGDSAHAMQPNMGQGGCMAIEDGYQLALELEKVWKEAHSKNKSVDIAAALKRYESERVIRVGAIHGMARMAAIMASTYKPYLGVGLGPLEFLTNLRIPHPGRVGGRFFINIFMPIMLGWVLGGNSSKLEGRVPSCRLSDKANSNLRAWFEDDDALERATDADWFLTPVKVMMSELNMETVGSDIIPLIQEDGRAICIGSGHSEVLDGNFVQINAPGVSSKHAEIVFREGAFYLTDLRSSGGTWITDIEGKRYRMPSLLPTRIHPGFIIAFGTDPKAAFKVKLRKSTVPPQRNDQFLAASELKLPATAAAS